MLPVFERKWFFNTKSDDLIACHPEEGCKSDWKIYIICIYTETVHGWVENNYDNL